jgi:ABC-type glutathione transport system ATPase component
VVDLSPRSHAKNLVRNFFGSSPLKTFPLSEGSGSFMVLQDINLSVHQNEIVALLGRSGSGKTTIFVGYTTNYIGHYNHKFYLNARPVWMFTNRLQIAQFFSS